MNNMTQTRLDVLSGSLNRTLTLSHERPHVKITNDGLTRSDM